MSAMWEIQKALYDALAGNTTFMNLISNKLYDEPPTDTDYPYVVIGTGTERSDNRLNKLGYENTLTFFIHTKPYGLGWYPATQILNAMNAVLNIKRFTMASFNMPGCKLDNVMKEKDEDKRILHVRYRVWAHSDTTHSVT